MITFTIINESNQIRFTPEDMNDLNQNNRDIQFEEIPCDTLIPQDIIIVLIEISRNIGSAAIYDTLKYSFICLLNLVQKKLQIKKGKTLLEIDKDGKKFRCYLSFDLTEAQKDKIVDAFIEELKTW